MAHASVEKVVMFLDGGFVKKKLQEKTKTFPGVQEIVDLCKLIMSKPELDGRLLHRVYYYDAPPWKEAPLTRWTTRRLISPQPKRHPRTGR